MSQPRPLSGSTGRMAAIIVAPASGPRLGLRVGLTSLVGMSGVAPLAVLGPMAEVSSAFLAIAAATYLIGAAVAAALSVRAWSSGTLHRSPERLTSVDPRAAALVQQRHTALRVVHAQS